MPLSDKTQLAIEDPDTENQRSEHSSDWGDQRIVLRIWIWREHRRREVSYIKDNARFLLCPF